MTEVRPADSCILAAIDVGTNSIRLVVAEGSPDGRLRIIDDEKETTRLGQGLNATGRLQPGAIEASVGAIDRMKRIAEGYGARQIRIVGTSAARVAVNGDDFIEAIRRRAGLELEVLSGEEEAKLAFVSVASAFDIELINAAVVDIGGGSVEVVLAAGGVVQQVRSLDVGAVRLTERFGPCEDDARAYNNLRAAVRRAIRAGFDNLAFSPHIMFGTGGTFTSVAAMEAHRRGVAGGDVWPKIRGFELQRAEVRHHLDRLRVMTVDERADLPGVSRDRAEIAVAGLVLAETLMRHLTVNTLRVHDRGIREGMLLQMLAEAFPPAGSAAGRPRDRLRGIREFGERCRFDPVSAGHVAALALTIFDALATEPHFAGPWCAHPARELLEAAALLHDVGYFINYAKHHKHSYHLIVHSDVAGYTHRELEIIAQIARYHRRAEPRLKHAPYAALELADRDIVCRLGGILRLAVGRARPPPPPRRAREAPNPPAP
ncbi:MAG: Ppx/GppA phosphatase family protein, partial [Planctomycetota bacterium]